MKSLQHTLFTLLLSLVLAGLGFTAGCAPNSDTTQVAEREGAEAQTDTAFSPSDAFGEPDVPYVPTPQSVVDRMLELAEVSEDDIVYDLGSGDGRIVITAAQDYGARGVGIEIDPERIEEARENAREAGVEDLVEFREENLFDADLSEATVVTLYLLPDINMKLRPKLFEELEPGTPVVSHDFDMEDWEPERTVVMDRHSIYYWTIPEEVPEHLQEE